ncbi:SRPBCC family protein [Streptomyces sp. AC536]|uniref:SRPBCC family protein n=1 Tax=Streptomyces buecherae TaxID=2763006 RepID=UPI00164EAB75|nr:SRPBCC family protein [Streptomyces buecherae]MBC3984276.1 SRPBCC family protein [Streptomyces buecherae]QNJ41055.1 SRPBCC family protein [Streptomyces buecherae]
MDSHHPAQGPAAYACMIVRKPADEAFRAFADPAVTSRFWYSRSSGPMVPGAELRWEWETYGATVDVRVGEVRQGELIRFEWGDPERPTTVELTFTPRPAGATFVEVSEVGFRGSEEELTRWLNDTVGGFTTALCAMKALLEHGIELGAVPDHHPAP